MMANDDLISRSALKEELAWDLASTIRMSEMCKSDMAIRVLDKVDEAPAVVAAPVVHARWVKDGERNTYCSHCEKYIPTVHFHEEYQDYECEWDEEIYETEYCPNCGARMDAAKMDAKED